MTGRPGAAPAGRLLTVEVPPNAWARPSASSGG